MPAKRQKRAPKFQYRLLWRYTGSKTAHELRADSPAPILRMLRRVATKTPWLGCGRMVLRKAWSRLCFRLNVPFDAISGLAPKDVVQRIQDSFPKLDWIRVEHRQVGDWVETIDPLNTLRTDRTDKDDARTTALFEEVAGWDTQTLDDWRTRVEDDYRLRTRKTASNNRENTSAPPRAGVVSAAHQN